MQVNLIKGLSLLFALYSFQLTSFFNSAMIMKVIFSIEVDALTTRFGIKQKNRVLFYRIIFYFESISKLFIWRIQN